MLCLPRYIKLSSPNLNNVIIVGSVMMYSTIFLDGLDGRLSDASYTHVCRVRHVHTRTHTRASAEARAQHA